MNERSSSRILIWALALSLTVHFVFAIVARAVPPAEAAPEQRPQHIEIVRIATPPPTPPPTPRPTRQPRPAPASHQSTNVRVSVHPPHVVARGGGSVSAGPPAIATAGPSTGGDGVDATVSPSPAPACSNPFQPAHAIAALIPEAPEDATGIKATAQVQVTLDDRGRVTDTRIFSSTGTMSLDRAAVDAARRTTYAPSIVECQPAGGTYLFKVDFDS